MPGLIGKDKENTANSSAPSCEEEVQNHVEQRGESTGCSRRTQAPFPYPPSHVPQLISPATKHPLVLINEQ